MGNKMIANQDKLEAELVPALHVENLQRGRKYPLETSVITNTNNVGYYLGKNIAFGCKCCEGGMIYGHFFASGDLKNLGHVDLTIIPEQDIAFSRNGYINDRGGALLRSFAIGVDLANILRAPEESNFYGFLNIGSIKRMFKESELVSEAGR